MKFARRYARFVLFFGLLVVVTGGAALAGVRFAPAVLVGFDIAALAYAGVTAWSLGDVESDEMRKRAAENEPDRHIMQILAAVVLGVVITAVGFELTAGSGGSLALSGSTLILAWLFGNILYAVHYAHVYYLDDGRGKDAGGLDFPGDGEPRYWDFAYFAFVLGMTFQVSDVAITTTKLRRVALFHSLIAFLFNLGVIALTVSLLGDAIK